MAARKSESKAKFRYAESLPVDINAFEKKSDFWDAVRAARRAAGEKSCSTIGCFNLARAYAVRPLICYSCAMRRGRHGHVTWPALLPRDYAVYASQARVVWKLNKAHKGLILAFDKLATMIRTAGAVPLKERQHAQILFGRACDVGAQSDEVAAQTYAVWAVYQKDKALFPPEDDPLHENFYNTQIAKSISSLIGWPGRKPYYPSGGICERIRQDLDPILLPVYALTLDAVNKQPQLEAAEKAARQAPLDVPVFTAEEVAQMTRELTKGTPSVKNQHALRRVITLSERAEHERQRQQYAKLMGNSDGSTGNG